MGTGKSSAGKILAQKMKREFIDTDLLLEKQFALSISEIFSQKREQEFREAEQALMLKLAQQEGLVIATGGGTLLSSESLATQKGAHIFCLNAQPATIAKRLDRADNRPLLANQCDQQATIEYLLADRQARYQKIFCQISTDNKLAQQIADEIYEDLEAREQINAEFVLDITPEALPPYQLFVKQKSSKNIDDFLKIFKSSKEVAILYDENLADAVQDIKKILLIKNYSLTCIKLSAQEQLKNLATVSSIYGQLAENYCSRSCTILAVGGGIVGDIAGFIAASYMRGLKLIYMPTTLLAMIDASIGGKNGVNLPHGKNLIGTFKNPAGIIVDPHFLNSLPPDDFSAGLAEVIKHGIIGDEKLLQILEKSDFNLEQIIFRSILVKSKIISVDPWEKNERKWLNLGHTFGHAFEIASKHKIRHGHAVALGMLAAIRLGIMLGKGEEAFFERIKNLLKKHKLPVVLEQIDLGKVKEALNLDKKREHNERIFVLAPSAQHIELIKNPPKELVMEAIELISG